MCIKWQSLCSHFFISCTKPDSSEQQSSKNHHVLLPHPVTYVCVCIHTHTHIFAIYVCQRNAAAVTPNVPYPADWDEKCVIATNNLRLQSAFVGWQNSKCSESLRCGPGQQRGHWQQFRIQRETSWCAAVWHADVSFLYAWLYRRSSHLTEETRLHLWRQAMAVL
jgi:hypothetical protein